MCLAGTDRPPGEARRRGQPARRPVTTGTGSAALSLAVTSIAGSSAAPFTLGAWLFGGQHPGCMDWAALRWSMAYRGGKPGFLARPPPPGRCWVVASSAAVASGSGFAGQTAVASCLPVVPGGGHAGPPLVDLDQAGFQ